MHTCRDVSERLAPTDDDVACRKPAGRHRHCLHYTAEPGLCYRLDVRVCCMCALCVQTQAQPRQPCAGCVCTQLSAMHSFSSHRHHVTQQNVSFCHFPSGHVLGPGGRMRCKWAARWAPSAESLYHISCMSIPPPPKMTQAGK